MRTFKGFNDHGNSCPICKTKDNKETVLVGEDGTEDDGNIKAMQVHLDCLDLRFVLNENMAYGLIYHKITREDLVRLENDKFADKKEED